MKRAYEVDYPIAKKFARVRLLTQTIFLSSGIVTGIFVAHAANAAKALAVSQTIIPSANVKSSTENVSTTYEVTSNGLGADAHGARVPSESKKSTHASSSGVGDARSTSHGGASTTVPTTRATNPSLAPTTPSPSNLTTTTRAPSSPPVSAVVPTTAYTPPTTVPVTTSTVCTTSPSGKTTCN
jgi:hypothetical protein